MSRALTESEPRQLYRTKTRRSAPTGGVNAAPTKTKARQERSGVEPCLRQAGAARQTDVERKSPHPSQKALRMGHPQRQPQSDTDSKAATIPACGRQAPHAKRAPSGGINPARTRAKAARSKYEQKPQKLAKATKLCATRERGPECMVHMCRRTLGQKYHAQNASMGHPQRRYFRRTWQRPPSSALHESTAADAWCTCAAGHWGKSTTLKMRAWGAPAKTPVTHPSQQRRRMGHRPLRKTANATRGVALGGASPAPTKARSYWALKVKSDVFDSLGPIVTV